MSNWTTYPWLPQLPPTYPNLTACVNIESFYSCENTTAIVDTCCSPSPGGLVLQAQFWDTYTGFESQGQLLPKDSWGVHGLWPDFCNGSVMVPGMSLLLLTFCPPKILHWVLRSYTPIRPCAGYGILPRWGEDSAVRRPHCGQIHSGIWTRGPVGLE